MQDMSQYLSLSELQELQRVLLKHLVEEAQKERHVPSNEEYLTQFLEAKRIEGLSEKTIEQYENAVRGLLRELNQPISKITTEHLRIYLSNYQITHNRSKSSLDTLRRCLSSFFSWLCEEDYILRNPIKRIHKIKTVQRVKTVLSDEDVEILRDHCKNIRNRAIVDLLYATGMRVSELTNLNTDDIDFINRECVIFGKGSKERTVYFDAKTKIHLQDYIDSRDDKDPALFVSSKKPHQRLKIGSVEKILREMGHDLGIQKVHPHKFRRSMATKAIDKGMPVEQLQQLLGHTEISTTMQYAMVNQNNVKQSYRKILA